MTPDAAIVSIAPAAGDGRATRLLACLGALLAGVSVGLAAYAAHAVEPGAQERLQSAAWFAFGHGIALAALAPRAVRVTGLIGLVALALGTLLFSGSLLGAHVFATPTFAAPYGGFLMMFGWLLWAADSLRR